MFDNPSVVCGPLRRHVKILMIILTVFVIQHVMQVKCLLIAIMIFTAIILVHVMLIIYTIISSIDVHYRNVIIF